MVKDRKRRSKGGNISDAVPESPSVSANVPVPKSPVNGKNNHVEKNGIKNSSNVKKVEAVNGTKKVAETPAKTKKDDTLGARNHSGANPKKNIVNSGGSLCVLLTQGIMAKDSEKINTVLSNNNFEVINNTLRELKTMHVFPLLKELELRLRTRGAVDIRPWIRWINCTISVHMSYLTSVSTVESEVGSLITWLKSRIGHQTQLQALNGKISIIADQIKRRTNKVVISQQPMVVFNNDDDSDPEDNESVGSDESGESSDDGWWDDEQLKQNGNEDEDEDVSDDDDEIADGGDDSEDGEEDADMASEDENSDDEEEMDTR